MITISLAQALNAHPSLLIRRAELRKRLRKLCRRHTGALLQLSENQVLAPLNDVLEQFKSALFAEIDDVAMRPYSGPEVLKRLPISNAERIRWTKQNRLIVSGNNIVTRGQRVSVVTYDVTSIDEIAEAPSILEEWRRLDGSSR